MLQKRLAWPLFVLLLSTLVCCQPTELILGFVVDLPIVPLICPPHSLYNHSRLCIRMCGWFWAQGRVHIHYNAKLRGLSGGSDHCQWSLPMFEGCLWIWRVGGGSWVSLRFEKRLHLSINPRKLSLFYRSFLNQSEALVISLTIRTAALYPVCTWGGGYWISV